MLSCSRRGAWSPAPALGPRTRPRRLSSFLSTRLENGALRVLCFPQMQAYPRCRAASSSGSGQFADRKGTAMRELLFPNQYPEGTATIKSWARPVRAAYVIPTGRRDLAIRAIASSCLTWSGTDHAFIPYDGGLNADWLEIIERYDPDCFVDLAGMPPEAREHLQASGRFVHEWQSPLDSFFTPGALLHSAALAFLEKPKPPGLMITVPKVDDTHPLYLQVLATHGILDEAHIDETLKNHGVRPGLRLADVVSLCNADCSDGLGALTGPLFPPARCLEGRGSGSFTTPIGLASKWVPRYPPSQYFGDVEEFEFDEPVEQHIGTVVVTGDPNSVSDLCLFWTIRATRPSWVEPFPLWIPLAQLKEDEAQEIVRSLVYRLDERVRAPLAETAAVHILSGTASRQRIRATLRLSMPLRIHTANFARFIPRSFRRGFQEQYEMQFRRGRGQVRRPSEQRIYHFAQFDPVAQEIEVAGYRLPQAKALKHGIFGAPWRITHTGYEGFFYPRHAKPLASLQLPSTWRALEAIFEDAGYCCAPSDKGRLAVGLLELLGSLDRLALIGSSLTYGILDKLARVKGRQAFQKVLRRIPSPLTREEADHLGGVIQAALQDQERGYIGYSEFNGALGKLAEPVLRWLLSRKVVFRGAELRCPNCRMRRWYDVDRIGSDFRCDGCQRVLPSPLEVKATNWKYRLNELWAHGYDQGVLLHLLLAYQRSRHFGVEERSSLGFYPGVDVSRIDSRDRPMELDYVEIKEGKLIIGECKVDGRDLEREQTARLAGLAQEVGCSRVVLASATGFPRKVVSQIASGLHCKLDVLEGQDLFDETPWGWRARGQRDRSVIAAEYLKYVSGWFFSGEEGA